LSSFFFIFLGDPDPQLVVALYASVGIGAIPLAVSPLLAVPEIAAIVEDAEPQILIHDNRHADSANSTVQLLSNPPRLFSTEAGSTSPMLSSLIQKDLDSSPDEGCKRNVDETAVLIYTGGTTGRPKGVMHSHRGMAAWNQFTPSSWFWL
jgi:long-chain acyl-CoA synthetase